MTTVSHQTRWEHTDLAALASRAAIELDNLMLNRPTSLDAARGLAERLGEQMHSSTGMNVPDISTVVALRRALIETPGLTSATTLDELVKNAVAVTGWLSTAGPNATVDLESLRKFCVALSREATASQRSPFERPEQQFLP
jgi:hypothetical protein